MKNRNALFREHGAIRRIAGQRAYAVAPCAFARRILDLRRTFGTKLAELGVLPHIVERLLNHKLGTLSNRSEGVVTAVAEVYNRATYMPEMRDAVRTWEARLSSLENSAQQAQAA